ncbi:hypothetical protein [Nitrosospira multiformis]|uniref:hypothetical protein n=1 Tax=Nitrosospira multiformis TaxID=1231 RepID=UPI0015A6011B|nr:hypothetical protein [Nitrosospira multiformis]
MDIALEEVCADHGFDAADARKIVDAKVFVPLERSEAIPDPGTLAEVKDLLLCTLQDKN